MALLLTTAQMALCKTLSAVTGQLRANTTSRNPYSMACVSCSPNLVPPHLCRIVVLHSASHVKNHVPGALPDALHLDVVHLYPPLKPNHLNIWIPAMIETPSIRRQQPGSLHNMSKSLAYVRTNAQCIYTHVYICIYTHIYSHIHVYTQAFPSLRRLYSLTDPYRSPRRLVTLQKP